MLQKRERPMGGRAGLGKSARRRPRVVVPAAVAAALSLALAACGSDSDKSTSPESASAGSAGQTASVPQPRTAPPTEIPIKQPLEAAPEKGKTFFWLQCELPICGKIAVGVKQATAAIGWNYQSLVFKAADPGAGLESAIQRKPDVIGITGIPSAAVKSQLAAAAAAGIPVVTCSPGPEQPGPATYASICSRTTEPNGENLALWAIKDSGSKAHIVTLTISSFPVLGTTVQGIEKAVEEHCPDCSTDILDLTVDDLGAGQVAPKLIAYLQSHPDVNYALFTFADLAAGVPGALKSARLSDKVTLLGGGGGEAQFKTVAGGGDEAWGTFPSPLEGWEMVDAAIRLVSDRTLPDGYQEQIDVLPNYIVDTPEAAKELAPSYDWDGPTNYQEQFKELWKLG
jgi:ABC-type sugar transport system substrate-binding protein